MAARNPGRAGESATVCLVDSGVDTSYPDLQGLSFAGMDLSGHGSPDGAYCPDVKPCKSEPRASGDWGQGQSPRVPRQFADGNEVLWVGAYPAGCSMPDTSWIKTEHRDEEIS